VETLEGLTAGESNEVTVTADRRLLARFDGKAGKWSIAEGTHNVAVGNLVLIWC
jgi:hypothetical protein